MQTQDTAIPTTASGRAPAITFDRVSTFLQRSKGYRLAAGAEEFETHAARLDAEIVARFVDDDSGREEESPGLEAALDYCDRHPVAYVLVPEPDRFARNVRRQLDYKALFAARGVRVSYTLFDIDTTSDEGEFFELQMAALAQYQSRQIARKTRMGTRRKATEGRVIGNGAAPFGYRFDRDGAGKVVTLVPCEQTAPILRRIYREALTLSAAAIAQGLTADGIAPPLTARGVTPSPEHTWKNRPRKRRPAAGSWNPSSVRGILTSSTYTGTFYHGRRGTGGVTNSAPPIAIPIAEPLVSEAEARAVRGALTARRRASVPRAAGEGRYPFWLRGRLRCACCAENLTVQVANGYHYYRRRGGTGCRVQVPAVALDTLAQRAVAEALLDPDRWGAAVTAAVRDGATLNARRAERLAVRDAEIARLEAALLGVERELTLVPKDGARARALRTVAAELEEKIEPLRVAREELAAREAPGFTAEMAAALNTICDDLLTLTATPARVFQIIDLRATVRPAAAGRFRLGRGRFDVTFRTRLGPVALSDGSFQFLDCTLSSLSSDGPFTLTLADAA